MTNIYFDFDSFVRYVNEIIFRDSPEKEANVSFTPVLEKLPGKRFRFFSRSNFYRATF